LAFTGLGAEDMGGVIFHEHQHGACVEHALLLVEVEIDEACGVVEEHFVDEGEAVGVMGVGALEAEAYNYFFGFRPLP